jgi:menaquinone-9 beta-reductase
MHWSHKIFWVRVKHSLISILGGGPAGASAAIAACREGSAVHLIDKAKFPRHKVCGEFFSPEIAPELEQLGAWDAFLRSGPARVHRMKLHWGRREKVARLPESAWGLSRYAFDALLRGRAQELGAELMREPIAKGPGEAPTVIASGRRGAVRQTGSRLFGFKAHFEGHVDDAIELFFFGRCYVGINAVENGRTNVCGLGPEDFLRQYQFDYDRVVSQCPALAWRLAPLTRRMKWLSTGPLRYEQVFEANGGSYLAGDALSFVDPFTGSGLLAAVKTGALAGVAAARGEPVEAHRDRCRSSLKQPFEIARIFRAAVDRGWLNQGWTEWLASLIPSRVLFGLTRPRT